ncbi:MAG: hypothetical protein QOE92_1494 [Chloroflexota bacterium]|nr:hypothetical protein [Chloroflexota bacterium]
MPPPRPGGRRLLLALSFGAIALTLLLVLLAGIGGFVLFSGGQAKVVGSTSELPRELTLCDHFQPARMVYVEQANGGRRYHVEGTCPVNPLILAPIYMGKLASAGWTVHSDGGGSLEGFDYQKSQLIDVLITDDSSEPNTSTVAVELSTKADVPPDFQ